MNIPQLIAMLQDELPVKIEIGAVVAVDPRGSRNMAVRLSGGRVCTRVLTCVDGLAIGDEVLVARSKDRDTPVVFGRMLLATEAVLSRHGALAPPDNLVATGVPAAIVLQWDTYPGEDVSWQVRYNSVESDTGATDVLVTRGSYYYHPIVDDEADTGNPETWYFKVRSLRWVGDNNVMYSAWSTWVSDISVSWLKTHSHTVPDHDHSAGSSQGGQNLKKIRELQLDTAVEVTIAAGVITPPQMYVKVDTEADAATDDLVTITAPPASAARLLVIAPINAARTVVVKHNTGNIWTGGDDISLEDLGDHLILIYDGTEWAVIGGSAAIAGTHSVLSATHDDTDPGAVQAGDLMTGQEVGVVNLWKRLAHPGIAQYYLGTAMVGIVPTVEWKATGWGADQLVRTDGDAAVVLKRIGANLGDRPDYDGQAAFLCDDSLAHWVIHAKMTAVPPASPVSAGLFEYRDNADNVVFPAIRLLHGTSAAVPDAGFGVRLAFALDDFGNPDVLAGAIDMAWVDGGGGGSSRMVFYVTDTGHNEIEAMRLTETGIEMPATFTVDGVDVGSHVHTGAAGQGPKLDHGAALDGLGDDDHAQYLKEEASGGTAAETPDHTHQAAATCGKLDHGLALDGLADDDHAQYLKEKASGGTAAETPAHAHQAAESCGQLDHGLALTGLGDDDHTGYLLATGARTGASANPQKFTNDVRALAGLWVGSDNDPDDNDIHCDGSINASTALGCRVYRDSAQTIANNTVTPISFSDELYDTDTCWAVGVPTKFYAKHAGYHMAGGCAAFYASAAGASRRATLVRLNGATYLTDNELTMSENIFAVVSVTTGMFYMNGSTDYVEICVYQNTGGNLDIYAADATNQHMNNGWLVRVA